MPTTEQLNFLAWAKINLASMTAKYLEKQNSGFDINDIEHKMMLAYLFIKEIEYFVYLPEEDRLCLSIEDICAMVRKLKDFLSKC